MEKRYATEWDPPNDVNELYVPTAFETRNVGASLEVVPHVSPQGEAVRLDVAPQRVEMLGYDFFDAGKTTSGELTQIPQPKFFQSKASSTVTVQNGQQMLIGVHLLTKPENYMEIFIVQAWVTPIK